MPSWPIVGKFAAYAIGAGLMSGTALAAPCAGSSFGTGFTSYTCNSLGSVPGVPTLYGGVTFLNTNTLLIGGNANVSNGAIYQIGITRGVDNQITGFSGPASLYATAPYIDGGLTFGPGGVLFFTGFPVNTLGEIKSGSPAPDKTVTLDASFNSVGSVVFVPPGFANAGAAKIVSYNNGNWAHATLTPDGSGTYDVATTVVTTLPGGPEGEVYVSDANPGFSADSLLVSAFDANEVDAYEIDGNGDPLVGTESLFLSGLTGAEGAVIDPITGDFLFSTFGGDNQLVVVSGFVPPPPVPEPTALTLFATALAAMFGATRRRKPPTVSLRRSHSEPWQSPPTGAPAIEY